MEGLGFLKLKPELVETAQVSLGPAQAQATALGGEAPTNRHLRTALHSQAEGRSPRGQRRGGGGGRRLGAAVRAIVGGWCEAALSGGDGRAVAWRCVREVRHSQVVLEPSGMLGGWVVV